MKSEYMNRILIVLLIFSALFSCRPKSHNKESFRYNLSLRKIWATDSVFKSPESVCYDVERNFIYVSNINGGPDEVDSNGFLTKMNLSGEITKLYWIEGLNAPKGMDIFENKLFVTDITRIVEINLDTDSISAAYRIDGSKFLNDLTIDNEGGIYISDSQTNNIFYLKDGNISVWMVTAG